MRENPKKQEKSSLQKITFVLFFVFFFTFSGAREVQAWDAIAGSIYKQVSEEISDIIKGMTMGALKQAAIKLITKQVDTVIAGASQAGARFVTDWTDYLVKNPTRNAVRYANSYVDRALSGRGSRSYRKARNSVFGASTIAGEGFGKEAVLGMDSYGYEESYAEQIQNIAQKKIIEPEEWRLTYHENPKDMFAFSDPDLSKFNLLVQGDGNGGNTIWDAEAEIEAKYNEALAAEKTIAKTESVANSGFISEKVDGMVVKSGVLYKDAASFVESLPSRAMVAATNLSEVIAATAAKAVSGIFKRVATGVERSINRGVTSVTRDTTRAMKDRVNEYGPRALYDR